MFARTFQLATAPTAGPAVRQQVARAQASGLLGGGNQQGNQEERALTG